MKKAAKLLFVFFTFFSCKKENDPPTPPTPTGPKFVLKSISTILGENEVVFSIIFDITAIKGDIYLDEQAIVAEKTDPLIGGELASIMVMPNAMTIHSGDKNYFLISNGYTQEVMLRVKILNGGNPGFVGAKITSLKWSKDMDEKNPIVQTRGFEKFKSQLVYIK